MEEKKTGEQALSGWERDMDEPVNIAARPLVKLYPNGIMGMLQSLSNCVGSLEKTAIA